MAVFEEDEGERCKIKNYNTTLYLNVGDILWIDYQEYGDGKVSYSIKYSSGNFETEEETDNAAFNSMNFIVICFYIFGGFFVLTGIRQYAIYSKYDKIQKRTDDILAQKKAES